MHDITVKGDPGFRGEMANQNARKQHSTDAQPDLAELKFAKEQTQRSGHGQSKGGEGDI